MSDVPHTAEEHDCLGCENCFHCCCPPEPAPMPKVGSFLVCQNCALPMRVRSNIDRELWLEEIEMGDITRVADDHWPILRAMLRTIVVRWMWAKVLWKAIYARIGLVYLIAGQHRLLRRLAHRIHHWEFRRVELPRGSRKVPFGKYNEDGSFEAWFPVEDCFAGIDMDTRRGDVATIKTIACEGKSVPAQTFFVNGQMTSTPSAHCCNCAMDFDAHWHRSHCNEGPHEPCEIDHPMPDGK